MTNLKTDFQRLFPGKVFLENEKVAPVERYLREKRWIGPDVQVLKIERPGAGNMNLVIRVLTDKTPALILKQSRPWVEKYPQLAAPVERIMVEKTYYETIGKNEILASYSPDLLHFDEENFIMVLEDLGEAADFTCVYKKGVHFKPTEITEAITYLNILGELKPVNNYPENKELRTLNHQHIFHLPFISNNGFDLDDIQHGLRGLSEKAKSDTKLKARVSALGETYLGKGTTLLQGDFYPGSLLNVKSRIKVIDPEFSFLGPVEWDIAVFMAHLFMSGAEEASIRSAFEQFEKKETFDFGRFSGFVGVEILRRLIGLAQLPLEMDLDEKAGLIDRSILWVKQANIDILYG